MQKEQMLIHKAIYILFACCFEYNLHAAPLKSKAQIPPPLPFLSFFAHSLGNTTCRVHIRLGSPGPTKKLRKPIHGEMQKKAGPLHSAHPLWSRSGPLVSHMLEFQCSFCHSTNCMILSKLFNVSLSLSPLICEMGVMIFTSRSYCDDSTKKSIKVPGN